MKVSALAAGSRPQGTLLQPLHPPSHSPLCVRKSLQGALRGMWTSGTGFLPGLCDLGGQLGLSVQITCLQGTWAKVCIINMLVPACPSPTLAVLPHLGCQQCLSACTEWWVGSGGRGGLRSDLHPSISGTWEGVGAGATIRSGQSGLDCSGATRPLPPPSL